MKKVVIGMSGGVDSSVAALLLKNDGYEVLGITMKLIDNKETNELIKDAKEVCDIIGIKHMLIDFTKEFKDIVIKDFIDNYKNGLTPNPCVICNKNIKFNLLYKKAKELGYEYLATGHYINNTNNKLCLADSSKDQSYFLYGIDKNIVEKLVFPLSNFKDKDDIRKIAKDNNLPIFNKKDSEEICFIENDDYISFLKKYITSKSGNIIDLNGNILGKHDGLYKYTIGQRKGLGISSNAPLYVVDIDTINNNLIVGANEDLFRSALIADNVNLLVDDLPQDAQAKIRSRGVLANCKIEYKDNKLYIKFDEKQRAITKGQSVVLYKDNILLGGGIIKEVL